MEMTSERLRQIAAAARMIFGADEVEVGRGTTGSASITLHFNRDEGVASQVGSPDGPDGRRSALVVTQVAHHQQVAAGGTGAFGGTAPGETELAGFNDLARARPVPEPYGAICRGLAGRCRTLPNGSFQMSNGVFTAQVTEGDDPVEFSVICQVPAFVTSDFESRPWAELGRQWPNPERYLDKLRLFRERMSADDRRVIVTVCLAADKTTPEEAPHA